MRLVSLALLLLCCASVGFTQTRNCGTMDHLDHIEQQDPKAIDRMQRIERFTNRYVESAERVNGTITIPVVVHVVYRTSTENISDAQIASQMQVLNDDFRRLNADADNTWNQAADSEIEFCLATVDPNGNATNGVTRTQTSVSAHGTNDSVKSNSSGGKNAWPTDQYLNMWVCNIGGSILGYAQFPGGPASTDGVVMDYRYFGTIGTAQAPFDGGRTTTHEVGHWLNLRHIWGDGNCNQDDFVSDTPNSDAPNYGCATGHVSCSSVDMVQNYMDYSDDGCMNLFTDGQKTRMRALFAAGGFRESLLNSAACGAPPTPTCDDGIQNGNETGVDCGGPDCAPCPTCDDGIQNGAETGVDCGGPDCAPCPCFGTEVTVSITLDNYPAETAWSIVNASGQTVASGGTYGGQPQGSTVTANACLPDGCYDFVITDTYGDGICCQYGNGSYTVSGGGSTLASGGSFTSSQTTNFCVGGGPAPTCDDGVQNGSETGVDCGGPDCAPCATCNDGIQNQGETGVDCGGPCADCPTCDDGVQNGSETGIDCGGPDCAPCATCNDGIQNGSETGVDCGGPDCAPCNTGCNGTEVTLTLVLDNYPGETTWTLSGPNGAVASGSGYNTANSTVTETFCLPDGCYTFTINDSYGDGICCAYGNGSYTLTDGAGSTLGSGGQFGSSDAANFCLGDTGGGGGDCTEVTIDTEDFNNWGIWNDGGSDCARVNSTTYANSGSVSVRLRDNSGTASSMTTDNLDLSDFEEITIDFTYLPNSMENGEDFWLRINTGSGFQTVQTWASGSEFSNGQRYFESVTIAGPFTANTSLRFQCDASGNADQIYIDDVTISGCTNGTFRRPVPTPDTDAVDEVADELELKVSVAPNPARDFLRVTYELGTPAPATILLTDVNGRVIYEIQRDALAGKQQLELRTADYPQGMYLLRVVTEEEQTVRKVILVD